MRLATTSPIWLPPTSQPNWRFRLTLSAALAAPIERMLPVATKPPVARDALRSCLRCMALPIVGKSNDVRQRRHAFQALNFVKGVAQNRTPRVNPRLGRVGARNSAKGQKKSGPRATFLLLRRPAGRARSAYGRTRISL